MMSNLPSEEILIKSLGGFTETQHVCGSKGIVIVVDDENFHAMFWLRKET